MNRNPAIELFRVLMMFGIVLLHVCQLRVGTWPNNVLVSCVPGFVLISGYYGIRFSWLKLGKLYLMAVYASLIVPLAGGVWPFSAYCHEVVRCWNLSLNANQPSGFWFLHAYAVMSVLIIPLEMVIDGGFTQETARRLRKISLPMFAIVFGWGFLLKFRTLGPVVPTVHGLQAFSPITLLAVYLVGRNLAVWESLNGKLSLKLCAIVGLISFALCSFSRTYLCGYNSLLSVLLAMSTFCLVRNLRMPTALAKGIMILAPSMFPVFLIHSNMYLGDMPHVYMAFASKVFQWLLPTAGAGAILLTAFVVFFAAVLLDFPRRLMGLWWERCKGRQG